MTSFGHYDQLLPYICCNVKPWLDTSHLVVGHPFFLLFTDTMASTEVSSTVDTMFTTRLSIHVTAVVGCLKQKMDWPLSNLLLAFLSNISFFFFQPSVCHMNKSCWQIVLLQVQDWQKVFKVHFIPFTSYLLAKVGDHSETKVVLHPCISFPNVNIKVTPFTPSAQHHIFIPLFIGFFGIYCFSYDLPLNFIIASSIDCCVCGSYFDKKFTWICGTQGFTVISCK